METRQSLIKPNLQTPFHIDFKWWKQNDTNWKIYLQECLCEQHRNTFSSLGVPETIDWIDPDTAEVLSVDGFQHILMTHCAKQTGFITEFTTVVDAVFRTLLANGNNPLNSGQLSALTNRPSMKILLTISSGRVYKGLRPMLKSG